MMSGKCSMADCHQDATHFVEMRSSGFDSTSAFCCFDFDRVFHGLDHSKVEINTMAERGTVESCCLIKMTNGYLEIGTSGLIRPIDEPTDSAPEKVDKTASMPTGPQYKSHADHLFPWDELSERDGKWGPKTQEEMAQWSSDGELKPWWKKLTKSGGVADADTMRARTGFGEHIQSPGSYVGNEAVVADIHDVNYGHTGIVSSVTNEGYFKIWVDTKYVMFARHQLRFR